jgi:uncharacterized protein (DUF1778 family)
VGGRDDREAKDGLLCSYGNQAGILQARGRFEDAIARHKAESLCLQPGNKSSLQRFYGNQALILRAWGRLGEAMALHKREEAVCLELGDKDALQDSYGNQPGLLCVSERLDEAIALLKKQEALRLKIDSRDGLQRSYGNQATIPKSGERLVEAMSLHKKGEAICLELGTVVARAGRSHHRAGKATGGPRHFHGIEDAAGRSRSDFTLSAACRKAESVLLDRCYFELSVEAFQRFTGMLDSPPKDDPKLRQLLQTKAPLGAMGGGRRDRAA